MAVTDELAAVLAAGAGTQLWPLTDILPKALCPVDNVALVDLAIDRVQALTPRVAVNVHHGRALLEAHLAGRVHLSVEEPEVLGTAGALGGLRHWIDGRAPIVVNADAWHRFDLSRLVEGWEGEQVRLLVVDEPDRGDFGPWRSCGASIMPWSEVRRLPAAFGGLYEACWGRAGPRAGSTSRRAPAPSSTAEPPLTTPPPTLSPREARASSGRTPGSRASSCGRWCGRVGSPTMASDWSTASASART